MIWEGRAMRGIAAVGLVALVLTGCAPQRQATWYPGASSNAQKDQFECQRDATMMYPQGVGDVVSQAIANVNRQNAFGSCLSSRGWVAR